MAPSIRRTRSAAACIALATIASLIAASPVPATAAPRSAAIRYLGDVPFGARAQSVSATATAGTSDSPAAELSILRARLGEEASPASSGGRSPSISKALPNATDLSPTLHTGGATWRALNHFDSRYVDGGNSFSGEPADMGMCAGKGYVMELVNSAVQIYTDTGTAKLKGTYGNAGSSTPLVYNGAKALSLNEFFGLPIAFDRAKYFSPTWNGDPGTFGPSVFDILCSYDDATDTWFAAAAILGVDDRTGDLNGYSGILLGVNRGSPLDNWSIYSINTTNDGSDGTPDHHCSGGPCFGDYPQMGIDANGLYLTTNEFALFGSGFYGAQLYAIRKSDLVARKNTPATVYLDNVPSPTEGITFALQPANAQGSQRRANTMFFGMSHAPYTDIAATTFSVFRLANTDRLNATPPTLSFSDLSEQVVDVKSSGGAVVSYGAPNHALQKSPSASADTPYLNYLNAGAFGYRYAQLQSPIPLDAGDGRFQGAWLSGGYLFLTTATAATGTGGADYSASNGSWKAIPQRAAVAVFTVNVATGVASTTADARIVGVSGQNLIYPSVAVNAAGAGAIGLTLVGPNWWPVAGYVRFASSAGVLSGMQVRYQSALSGGGPNDGFSGTGDGGYRTRWGDYGAASLDAQGDVWIAAQSVEQRCSTSQYASTASGPFGTCGNTRTTLANWSTRIIEIDL